MRQIFVKVLDGRTLPFLIEDYETVGELKCRLAVREGITPQRQCLVYGSRQLLDAMTPQDANLPHNSTVHLVMRLHGGIFVETVELLWSFLKTLWEYFKKAWNFVFGKRCCLPPPPLAPDEPKKNGPCWCHLAGESDEESDASYDDMDLSSDEDGEMGIAMREQRRREKNALEGGPWCPPKQGPPLMLNPSAEDMRLHRSLFNMQHNGKWRVAPYPEPIDALDKIGAVRVVQMAEAENLGQSPSQPNQLADHPGGEDSAVLAEVSHDAVVELPDANTAIAGEDLLPPALPPRVPTRTPPPPGP